MPSRIPRLVHPYIEPYRLYILLHLLDSNDLLAVAELNTVQTSNYPTREKIIQVFISTRYVPGSTTSTILRGYLTDTTLDQGNNYIRVEINTPGSEFDA